MPPINYFNLLSIDFKFEAITGLFDLDIDSSINFLSIDITLF